MYADTLAEQGRESVRDDLVLVATEVQRHFLLVLVSHSFSSLGKQGV
jgi:hypothetical protein